MAALSSCGPRAIDQVPDPAVASAPRAQAELQALEEAWEGSAPANRMKLGPRFEAFARRYPNDPSSRRVRVYLGWIRLERGELDLATRAIEPTLKGPPGAARDQAQVVQAGILTRRGRPHEALELLTPLEGKLVTGEAQHLYGRERVRAALAARRWRLSVEAMTDWLEASGERAPRVREEIQRGIAEVPPHALSRLLADWRRAGRPEGASEVLLERAMVERVARSAVVSGDARLARQILDVAPSWLRTSDDGERLQALAANDVSRAKVAGRTIGLVLQSEDADVRRRSASVASGMLETLGMDGETKLMVRENRSGLTAALAAMVAEGASVLVAGVDESSAERALGFAEARQVPVLVLVEPSKLPAPSNYGFVLGSSDAIQRRALEKSLTARGIATTALIGASGTRCDSPPTHPGGPRYPVEAWRAEGVAALLVFGDAGCVERVERETRRVRPAPLLALGLEATEALRSEVVAERAVSLSAGAFPLTTTGARLSWFEALGRDAGALAKRALESRPEIEVEEGDAVRAHHDAIRDVLLRTEAELLTTSSSGFEGKYVVPRQLRLIEGEDNLRQPAPEAPAAKTSP